MIGSKVVSNLIPLTGLGNMIASWRYAPIASGEGPTPTARSPLRSCLSSKIIWRIVLSAALALLLVDLFHPRLGRLLPQSAPEASSDVDWSKFAYIQYVTNEAYLCNSVIIFDSISRLQSKASKVMMYPQDWNPDGDDSIGNLLRRARDDYDVQLSPIQVQHFPRDPTWADSFTKLLAFNQTQFKRVLSLDSDATILQDLDELFLLPSTPVAMPRAYWLDDDTLSSQLVVIEPSEAEYRRIEEAFSHRGHNDFDMEIVNELYGKDCIIIPHRRYDLLTGEFRAKDHAKYLGSKEEDWDPVSVLADAKYVHFSDCPLSKPWLPHSEAQEQQIQPECYDTEEGEDCRDREIWLGLYQDFRTRRDVCESACLSEQ